MSKGILLEVRIGIAEPASIAVLAGTPLDPTSFGRTAMWRIVAEGVLDIHGYVYFDGRSLFVQSADDHFPVLLNRHRIPTAWTEVRAPGTLFIGQAQIDLSSSDALGQTGAQVAYSPDAPGETPAAQASSPNLGGAPRRPQGPWDGSSVSKQDFAERAAPSNAPAVPNPANAPFPRGAFVPAADGESTRVAPLTAVTEAPKSTAFDDRALLTSPVIPVPIPPSAAAPPPKPQSSLWLKAKADWYATSLPKRIMLIISPLVAYSLLSLSGNRESATQHPAPSSSAPPATVSAPPATNATTAPQPTTSAAPVNSVPVASTTDASSGAPVPSPGSSALPAANGTAAQSGGDASKVGSKTLERAAADAFSEGNLPRALELYERLAKEHPENPAFDRAARIVRERMSSGGR